MTSSVGRSGLDGSEVAAPFLLALDRLEQGLEISLSEPKRAVPLDEFEKNGGTVTDRPCEDLEQVAVLIPVNQDAALLQLLDRHPYLPYPGPQFRVLVVGRRGGQELHAPRRQLI